MHENSVGMHITRYAALFELMPHLLRHVGLSGEHRNMKNKKILRRQQGNTHKTFQRRRHRDLRPGTSAEIIQRLSLWVQGYVTLYSNIMFLVINLQMRHDREGLKMCGMHLEINSLKVKNSNFLVLEEAIQPCFHDTCSIKELYFITSMYFKHACKFNSDGKLKLFSNYYNFWMHWVESRIIGKQPHLRILESVFAHVSTFVWIR